MPRNIFWIFKALQAIGVISKWSEKALEDGKVTLPEGIELLGQLGTLLGLPLELELPTATVTEPPQEIADAEEKKHIEQP